MLIILTCPLVFLSWLLTFCFFLGSGFVFCLISMDMTKQQNTFYKNACYFLKNVNDFQHGISLSPVSTNILCSCFAHNCFKFDIQVFLFDKTEQIFSFISACNLLSISASICLLWGSYKDDSTIWTEKVLQYLP